ncbi:hypothetical protein GCM10010832_13090 [Psychroflexus planctonicus]|uniref:Uncharacterized protein n=1 Tax=Psychroflexus planctonicus TaxID=1526575 RepID=A0ABQ1SFL0_9FLAO|nr:hypothetical protein GCM10010832_13090 [Psychroflexus planctonicus]
MLLAKNKNIKTNYNLKSNVVDGPIALTSVTRNGNESNNQGSLLVRVKSMVLKFIVV